MSLDVFFEIIGPPDAPETGIKSSFKMLLQSKDIVPTLGLLKEQFPYVGEYHFRIKVPESYISSNESSSNNNNNSSSNNSNYLWLDMKGTDQHIPLPLYQKNSSLEIRVLPLSFDGPDGIQEGDAFYHIEEIADRNEGDEVSNYYSSSNIDENCGDSSYYNDDIDDDDPYFHSGNNDKKNGVRRTSWTSSINALKSGVSAVTKTAVERTGHAINSETAHNLKQQTKTATKEVNKRVAQGFGFLKKVALDTVASSTGTGTGTLPTTEALETLIHIEDMLETQFTDARGPHILMLTQLWDNMFPSEIGNFQRKTMKWRDAGFQKPDPIDDLKGTGLLAIRCTTYFLTRYPEKAQDMILENKPRKNDNYPFACVCNNLTLLLVDLIKLKDKRFMKTKENFWLLFENEDAFFELFCITITYLNYMWRYWKVKRQDFGRVIGQCKLKCTELLHSGPLSIADMMENAHKLEMLYFH